MLFVAGEGGQGALLRLEDRTVHRNYSLFQVQRYASAFCARERTVVAFQSRSSALFFASHTQQPVQRSFTPEQVSSCVATPCGTFLIGGTQNGSLISWNLLSGQLLRFFKPHLRAVTSLSLSSDGSFVASCSEDSTCKVWTLASLTALTAKDDTVPVSTFAGHTLSVLCCTFFNNSPNLIATGSADKTSRVFDARTAEQLAVFTVGDTVSALAISGDDSLLAVGSETGFLSFRRLSHSLCGGAAAGTLESTHLLTPSNDGHHSAIVFMRFTTIPSPSNGSMSGDGCRADHSSSVLTVSEGGAILWYDAACGKLIGEAFPRRTQKICSCTFLPMSNAEDRETKPALRPLNKNPLDPTTALTSYSLERTVWKPRKAQRQQQSDDEEPTETATDDASRADSTNAALTAQASRNEELAKLRDRMRAKLQKLER